MKPDFKNTEFYLRTSDIETTETGDSFDSPEGIQVTADNYKAEIEDLEHIDFVSGLPPFLRGPYGSMYVSRPWTIFQLQKKAMLSIVAILRQDKKDCL
jgi:methylmalonyl-CoA mutase